MHKANGRHLPTHSETDEDMIAPPRIFDFRIVLASSSPRRRELMRMLVPDVSVAAVKDVDENYPADIEAERVPEWLSQVKADAYREDIKDGDVLLTADTVVILDGEILGKPVDESEACCMLKRLRGRTHVVVTGVTLSARDRRVSFSERTEVNMAPISDEEIEAYVSIYRPLDKAGAYGIQEWIGGMGITGIEGCFYNVMGLPLHAVYEHLKEF